MVIAAGTDYAIFIVGRYHEARNKGLEREAAYHDMFGGTVHVIVGSGLTIAGAWAFWLGEGEGGTAVVEAGQGAVGLVPRR